MHTEGYVTRVDSAPFPDRCLHLAPARGAGPQLPGLAGLSRRSGEGNGTRMTGLEDRVSSTRRDMPIHRCRSGASDDPWLTVSAR
jgi:hypothetical protein